GAWGRGVATTGTDMDAFLAEVARTGANEVQTAYRFEPQAIAGTPLVAGELRCKLDISPRNELWAPPPDGAPTRRSLRIAANFASRAEFVGWHRLDRYPDTLECVVPVEEGRDTTEEIERSLAPAIAASIPPGMEEQPIIGSGELGIGHEWVG